MKKELDKLILKNSIRLLVGGWLYDGGDIMEVPDILAEMHDDYIKAIDKETNRKGRK